jgi:hypothetical protein
LTIVVEVPGRGKIEQMGEKRWRTGEKGDVRIRRRKKMRVEKEGREN